MAGFLRKVYDGFDTSNDIEPTAWREALRSINEATVNGLSLSSFTSHEDDFLHAIRHSNEVFSAFKVHDMGQQMAARLIGDDGQLKPFSKWAEDVQGIASHHVGSWLRTEYNTAVNRAHNTADWKRFERDRDIYPNLRWMPTQSPDPEGSHQRYWEQKLTLPVEHPFWDWHHPGDRWNCKCSLEQTDEPATPELIDGLPDERPQRGLENNMGKDGHTFSQNHPYFPDNCNQCAFYKAGIKNRLVGIFSNRKKDCYNCPYIDKVLPSSVDWQINQYDKKQWEHTYVAENGFVVTDKNRLNQAGRGKTEMGKYLKEMNMCKILADNGHFIEHLADVGKLNGLTYDITIDGTPADLKKIDGGAGNIVKYTRKAFTKQGGEAVIFQIPSHDKEYYDALSEARRKYKGRILFYFADEKQLKEIK